MRRSSFTPHQIAEALAFAREEWPDEPAAEQASRAASYLDLVCGQDTHGDAMAQVLRLSSGRSVMAAWINRRDFPWPYQDASPFPPDAIVQIKNAYGDNRIGPAGSFWWGYERECGEIGEGVIICARRLDRARAAEMGK